MRTLILATLFLFIFTVLFFVADGTNDEPPIYGFEWETYEKVYDSF